MTQNKINTQELMWIIRWNVILGIYLNEKTQIDKYLIEDGEES